MTVVKDNTTPLTEQEIEELIAEHNKGGAFKAAIGQQCWDAGIEILPSCEHMTIPKYHVFFEPLADQKIKKLQSYYKSLEWLMYLVGEVDHEAHTVTVTDLVLPDSQRVTGVNVNDVEYTWPADGPHICGVIHSHHTMGAFFSGTDDAYINQNHDVSIVVATNPKSPIKGQVRVKTPCNAYVLSENCTFSVKYEQVLDEAEFEKQFTAKIHTYKPVVYTYPQNYGYGGSYLGNSSRGYSGSSYYHRGIGGNPNRTNQQIPSHGQLGFGYDTEEENDFPNPFTMSDETLREHLSDYYTPEEIDEFAENAEMAEELNMIQELCREGVVVATLDQSNDFESREYDPNRDVNAQTGRGQVASGVALRDQKDEPNVWELDSEDDLEFTFEGQDEIITLDVEHGEHGVIVKDRTDLH